MNYNKKIILGFCVVFSLNSFAQKYSNEFLSIGVGARALGMGNTQVSTVNDVTAGYWNPAGLNGLSSNMQLGVMHSDYFAGIAKYDYAGLAFRIDTSSVLAFSYIRFGVDDIPNTTELIDADGNIDYDRISSFSAIDNAFLISYARLTKIPNLKIGANLKIIRRKVGDFGGAWGFGLDASVQYNYKGWNFGAMARDVTTTFNAWSYTLSDDVKQVFELTGNEIPDNSIEYTFPKLILGASRKFDVYKKIAVMPVLDMDITTDGKRNVLVRTNVFSLDPHVGVELSYNNMIFVRGGITNIQDETDEQNKKIKTFQPTIGVGIKIKAITLDYALTEVGDNSIALKSNVFSLKFDINKKVR